MVVADTIYRTWKIYVLEPRRCPKYYFFPLLSHSQESTNLLALCPPKSGFHHSCVWEREEINIWIFSNVYIVDNEYRLSK